jgi:hypothetical protein
MSRFTDNDNLSITLPCSGFFPLNTFRGTNFALPAKDVEYRTLYLVQMIEHSLGLISKELQSLPICMRLRFQKSVNFLVAGGS